MRVVFVDSDDTGLALFAAAVASQQAENRGLNIEIMSGGVAPRATLRADVKNLAATSNVEFPARQPNQIDPSDLRDATIVVTIDDSFDHLFPASWTGDHHTWKLDSSDPERLLSDIRDRLDELFEKLTASSA